MELEKINLCPTHWTDVTVFHWLHFSLPVLLICSFPLRHSARLYFLTFYIWSLFSLSLQLTTEVNKVCLQASLPLRFYLQAYSMLHCILIALWSSTFSKHCKLLFVNISLKWQTKSENFEYHLNFHCNLVKKMDETRENNRYKEIPLLQKISLLCMLFKGRIRISFLVLSPYHLIIACCVLALTVSVIVQ